MTDDPRPRIYERLKQMEPYTNTANVKAKSFPFGWLLMILVAVAIVAALKDW